MGRGLWLSGQIKVMGKELDRSEGYEDANGWRKGTTVVT